MKDAPPPRSFVLLSVLIIGAGALLVTSSLLFLVHADLAGAVHGAEAQQQRMLAWSGVQAVMRELDGQRERILRGELPQIEEAYAIYETGDRIGRVRLLRLGPAGERLVPEAGRIDLNAADAGALAATGLVDPALAEAIIHHRDTALGGSYQTVAELLGVPGMEAETLYGPLEDLRPSDEAAGVEADLGARVSEMTDRAPRGLADVVTVYGQEPALQGSGVRQIDVAHVQWSEELGRRVEQRFGADSGPIVRAILAAAPGEERAIYEALNRLAVPPERWGPFLDAFTAEGGPYHRGRLDINTAPQEALMALPGIDESAAARIVRARESLPADERATVAWPAVEGIIEPQVFGDLAGHITTRCWTYRVRLAAEERRDEPAGAGEGGDQETPPHAPAIYEAVIDLAGPRPRGAYLREVSSLQTAAILQSRASLDRLGPAPAEAGAAPPAGGGEDREHGPDSLDGTAHAAPAAEPAGAGKNGPAGDPFDDDSAGAPPRRGRVGRWRSGR